MYNFNIHCGRNLEGQARVRGAVQESIVVHEVVRGFYSGLEYLGHCVAIVNYLSSIPLFVELASVGIYATGRVRADCVGLPSTCPCDSPFVVIVLYVIHAKSTLFVFNAGGGLCV